jgi:soluble lytic murein transglycosylase
LYRLAEKDPIQAVALLPEVGNRFFFSEDEMTELRYRAAWFSSVRELPANRAWLDSYLETSADPRLLEHRIRRAVTEQDWPAVAYWIERLPAGQQGARWHYWRARALEGLYQPAAAQPYFIQAAAERSFWGFLAAQRLGLPPSLNNEPLPLGLQQPLNAAGDALLQRVGLLLAVGERGHARGEWLFYLRKEQNPAQRDALASAAVAAGWPDLAIEAALQTHQSNKLDWRFPLAYDGQFAAAEEKHRVDRWLLMALARRESAFNPQASSPAGAQGLMQLMPGTARQMAGKAGMPFGNVAVLHDPAINIELGSQYLAGLLTRYQGNRVLALAAYNAGPSRVDRWLKDANDPMDVFIESIPFYETREYVQAVLAYRVIFSRHRDGSALLALLNESEMIAPYNEQWLAEAGRPGRVGPPPI